METVVLFADISGFTMISEACAAMGMVKALGKYGGDIIKFVGDAMIVMWPRFVGSSASGDNDDKVTIVRKAV